jgi:hypothetical protein
VENAGIKKVEVLYKMGFLDPDDFRAAERSIRLNQAIFETSIKPLLSYFGLDEWEQPEITVFRENRTVEIVSKEYELPQYQGSIFKGAGSYYEAYLSKMKGVDLRVYKRQI